MTISGILRTAGPYIGNNTTTVFGFTFKVFATDQLVVVKLNTSTSVETTLTLITDYTVTLNGNQNSNPGGSVTLPAVLATGYNLTLTSSVANLQPTDLTNQGGFYPEVITDALDRATIQIQQMSDDVTRSIKAPLSDDPLTMDMTLPVVADRINKILAFGATGMPTAVAQSPSSITGNTSIVGTLGVTGATTLSSTLGVIGATTLASVGVTGAATVGTTLGVTGATTLSSTLGVTGATTLSSTLGVTGATTIQGLTVGKGGGTIVSNTAFGASALAANTTGSYNNAFGYLALYSNTTGYFNHAFGKNALYSNTTGTENCAFGYETLFGNTTGVNNTAFGNSALIANVIGTSNTAVGLNSLFICTGNNNTAIGSSAGSNLTTGSNNTFIGRNATGSTATISNEVSIYNNSVTARFQGAAAAWTFVSDARDKENIENLNFGLNFINQLQPRKFSWNIRNSDIDKGKEASGFIAQELLGVVELQNANCLGLVYTNDPNQFSIAQTNLIPVLVNAIKELNAKFEAYVATHP